MTFSKLLLPDGLVPIFNILFHLLSIWANLLLSQFYVLLFVRHGDTACITTTGKAEARGLQVPGQAELHSKILSLKAKIN